MSAIRLFTDEDVYSAIAPALRRSGIDCISAPETGRLGIDDESQLEWATSQSRTVLTFNVGHFAALHSAWLSRGLAHSGIVVSNQRLIGDLLRRITNLATTMDSESMRNRLEFLSDW